MTIDFIAPWLLVLLASQVHSVRANCYPQLGAKAGRAVALVTSVNFDQAEYVVTMTKLVILPGLDGTASLHHEFQSAIASEFTQIISVCYPTNQVLNQNQLYMLAQNQLPDTEDYVLLGESFSGPIAIALAAQKPKGLRALILTCTFAKKPIAVPKLLAPLAQLGPVRLMPMAVLSWLLFGRWASPALCDELKQTLSTVAAKVLRSRAQMALQMDVSQQLGLIQVPTLYLRATHDRLISRSSSKVIAQGIKQCQIADIAAPHLLLQAAPNQAAEAIKEFLRLCE